MRITAVIFATVIAVASPAVLLSGPAGADPVGGNCNVTGNGALANGSTLAASVHTIDGSVRGNVTLTTADGMLRGIVVFVSCRRDGGGGPGVPGDFSPNISEMEGTGTWNGVSGYDWGCTVHDHGEGHSSNQLPDEFGCTVADALGTIVTQTQGLLVSGNFQLRPPQS